MKQIFSISLLLAPFALSYFLIPLLPILLLLSPFIALAVGLYHLARERFLRVRASIIAERAREASKLIDLSYHFPKSLVKSQETEPDKVMGNKALFKRLMRAQDRLPQGITLAINGTTGVAEAHSLDVTLVDDTGMELDMNTQFSSDLPLKIAQKNQRLLKSVMARV